MGAGGATSLVSDPEARLAQLFGAGVALAWAGGGRGSAGFFTAGRAAAGLITPVVVGGGSATGLAVSSTGAVRAGAGGAFGAAFVAVPVGCGRGMAGDFLGRPGGTAVVEVVVVGGPEAGISTRMSFPQ